MSKGIDVSKLSGNIDWDRVKAAGYDFCFIRAAYGDTPDLSAAEHLRKARRSGLACGVYHLLRVTKDAAAQVALMKSLVAFTFWQHSENAAVDGIAGKADLNYFNSDDRGALRALRLK